MKEEIAKKNLKEAKEIFDKFGIRFWLDKGTLLGAVRDGKIIEWDIDIDLGTMDDSWVKIVSAIPKLKERGFDVHLEKFKIYKNVFEKCIILSRFGCPISISLYQVEGENAKHELSVEANLFSQSLKVLCYLLSSNRPCVMSKWNFVVNILEHCLSLLPPKSRKPLFDVVWQVWQRSGIKFVQVVVPKHYFEKLETIKFYGMTFNIPSNVKSYLEYKYGEDWKTPKKEWVWWREDGAAKVSTAQ